MLEDQIQRIINGEDLDTVMDELTEGPMLDKVKELGGRALRATGRAIGRVAGAANKAGQHLLKKPKVGPTQGSLDFGQA